jgi:hypothetical protein
MRHVVVHMVKPEWYGLSQITNLLFYEGYLQGYTVHTDVVFVSERGEKEHLEKCLLIETLMMDIFTKHGWRFSNNLCYWFCYFPSMREGWVVHFALFCVWCDYCVEDRVYPTIENNVIIMVPYIARCRRPGTFWFCWWNKIFLTSKKTSL